MEMRAFRRPLSLLARPPQRAIFHCLKPSGQLRSMSRRPADAYCFGCRCDFLVVSPSQAPLLPLPPPPPPGSLLSLMCWESFFFVWLYFGYTNNPPRSMAGNATGKSQVSGGYLAKSGTGESDESGNGNKDQKWNGLTAWENIDKAAMRPPFGSEI
ncbi:hypothetical protein LZ31DRAFT_249051 [Colletotrichum somersetense]|nr:hypothetical protein LZ31DRAFT_249051 [Colletotrichum somersetense]